MSEKSSVDLSQTELLASAFDTVRSRMNAASGGREVTLVAATKTVSAERVNFAIDRLGLTDIGENRVQELLEKYEDLHKDSLKIHFIGRLQSNKVKYIVDKVCMIHSVDSLSLADEIERQVVKRCPDGRRMDVLAEVNLCKEVSKGGVAPEDAESFLRKIREYPHLCLRGIMVIPPIQTDDRILASYFGTAKQLFERFSNLGLFDSKKSPILSMGMSDSYQVAIENGSNLVRIGSALFGKRS